MTKSTDDGQYSEAEAARRRDAALRVAFTLPHKPHSESSAKGKKAAPKRKVAKKRGR